MKSLKQEIQHQELRVSIKKDQATNQYQEFRTLFQHKISSPLGLGVAFAIGFISSYGIASSSSKTGVNKLAKISSVSTVLQIVNKGLRIVAKFI